jgi:hypothetical protein
MSAFVVLTPHHAIYDASGLRYEPSGGVLLVNVQHIISIRRGKRFAQVLLTNQETLIVPNEEIARVTDAQRG